MQQSISVEQKKRLAERKIPPSKAGWVHVPVGMRVDRIVLGVKDLSGTGRGQGVGRHDMRGQVGIMLAIQHNLQKII